MVALNDAHAPKINNTGGAEWVQVLGGDWRVSDFATAL